MSSQSDTPPVAIFVANRGFGLTNSRMPLMAALIDRGMRVVACTAPDATTGQLASMGVTVVDVPFARGGFRLQDLIATARLAKLCRVSKPRLVHHFNAKPVAYGGIASRGLPTRVVHTVTGLGYGFEHGGLDGLGARMGYRLACPSADAVIFQNYGDRDLFVQRGWALASRSHVIVGSGVDVERFRAVSLAGTLERPRVLMVARMLWSKGISEFVEAARRVRQRGTDTEFVLGGEWQDGHPDAVDRAYIDRASLDGVISFIGYVTDMAEELARSSVFVLPSYYREGVPRVLLEASATGLPVVTTDAPGCRDVVLDGQTGLLVEPRNVAQLSSALDRLIRNPTERARMGESGRSFIEENFSLAAVTQRQLDVYASIGVIERPTAPERLDR